MSPAAGDRADRLEALATEAGLDLLLVGDLVRPGDSGPDAIANVRWLTGFTGTSGFAIVGAGPPRVPDRLPLHGAGARARSDDAFERDHARGPAGPGAREALCGQGRVRRRGDQRAVARQAARGRRRRRRARGRRPASSSACGAIKDEDEIEAIAEATPPGRRGLRVDGRPRARRADRARGRAIAAQARMRELGAEPAFPAIVAAGPERRASACRAERTARSAPASWS